MSGDQIQYNSRYSGYLKSEDRYAVLFGGAGSGKSYTVAQKLVYRCVQNKRERILVIRNVYRTCRESTFRLLIEVASAFGVEVTANRSDLSITFPNGAQIIHAGLDDPEKLKSIAGITSVWIEEASEVKEDAFRQVDLRLRGDVPTYKQVTLTLNPTDSRLWVRRWLDENPDIFVLRTTWRDNAFLDKQYIDVLKSLPEDLRAIYERGEWGEALKGVIFPNWKTYNENREPDFYGIDFGYNSPSAVVAVTVTDPDVYVREVIYQSGLTNSDLIAELKKAVSNKNLPIYCDAAEPDRIEELIREGLQAYKADKSVKDGIDFVKRYNVNVHAGSQNLQNELREYRWDEDRKSGELKDVPLKRHDHAVDAMRYAIYTHLKGATNTWGVW